MTSTPLDLDAILANTLVAFYPPANEQYEERMAREVALRQADEDIEALVAALRGQDAELKEFLNWMRAKGIVSLHVLTPVDSIIDIFRANRDY